MERNVYLPQQKTFLFVKVIRYVQAVRYLTLWLKLLNNRTHRVTEGTEVKPILQRCRWHKEQRRCSVQIPDTF